MKYRKLVKSESLVFLGIALIVAWPLFNARLISGERSFGGCLPCRPPVKPVTCPSQPNRQCTAIAPRCVGININYECVSDPGWGETDCQKDEDWCVGLGAQRCR